MISNSDLILQLILSVYFMMSDIKVVMGVAVHMLQRAAEVVVKGERIFS